MGTAAASTIVESFEPIEVFSVLLKQLGGDVLIADIRKLEAIHLMLSRLAEENQGYMGGFVFNNDSGIVYSPTLADILKRFEDEGVLTGKTMASYHIDWAQLNRFLPDDIRLYSEFKHVDALRQLMRRR